MIKGNSSRKSGQFTVNLMKDLQPDDTEVKWKFRLQNFPNLGLVSGQKIALMCISVTHEGMVMNIEKKPFNRILSSHANQPEAIIGISFENFRFPEQPIKLTTDYIERLLSKGIELNSRKYIYYGHSNSQLKSRTCYLYRANSGEDITRKINEFGDFSNFMSVAKRAKRIGLLFSAAEASILLNKKHTQDIDDVESDGHIFTDGCGMISLNFAQELARKQKITFQNRRYCPSAYQIRYKGYKGMLMVNPELDTMGTIDKSVESLEPSPPRIKLQFRQSMRKFNNCPDDSFSILDYSKPFSYAFLNGELVTLLSCLGIADEVFEAKQKLYFKFLENASTIPQEAFKYFCYKFDFKAAEEVLLEGLTDVLKSKIKKLTREEWNGTYKKNDAKDGNERVRIMIPESRILFGVCDYSGSLAEGECHIRITTESGGLRSIDGGHVIVSRNPCLHPGDMRKFIPVEKANLNHLVDCIVFPIVGKRDPASLMSGGDLDGDRFFVSWDKDIIPSRLYEPYGYPPAKEAPRRDITYLNMIEYFARYNNASLGRVKNLYLDWCRSNPIQGAGSVQCQELNKLFSSCVDGEKIKIPSHLEPEKIPKPDKNGKQVKFILDILCENVKKSAETIFRNEIKFVDLTTREVLEELLSSSDMCNRPSLLNEYELYLMTLNWCKRNRARIVEFIHFFDFGTFTTPQKHAILASLSEENKWYSLREQYVGQIFNGLHQSDILWHEELRSRNLHTRDTRWQKFYSSFSDDGLRLTTSLERAIEHFDKKLIVFQVDSDLKVAIYIPKRIEKYAEINVGELKDMIKFFAFQPQSGKHYSSDARKGYKIYFDGEILQLFEIKRQNTFVWFALNEAYAERNSIQSNSEFKVSIALQKFDNQLSKSHGRVIKHPSQGIEIYVISNRDRIGHQIKENTWNEVATQVVVTNLQNTPLDYGIPGVKYAPESEWKEFCNEIIVNCKLNDLSKLTTINQFKELFDCCLETQNNGNSFSLKLFDILPKILENFKEFEQIPELPDQILDLVTQIPKLSIIVTQELFNNVKMEIPGNFGLPQNGKSRSYYYYSLAVALVLSTNEYRECPLKNFKELLQLLSKDKSAHLSLTDVTKLVKLICFAIRDFDLAQEFIATIFNEDDYDYTNLFNIENDSTTEFQLEQFEEEPFSKSECFKYFSHFIQALALEYLAQVQENCPCDFWGLPLGAENQSDPVGLHIPRNHLNNPATLNQFFSRNALGGNKLNLAPPDNDRTTGRKIEPNQKCLVIKYSPEKKEIFETILRPDIICNIRNEDHLRFCASKRPNNEPKKVTVFDAIAVSISGGKLEFRIVQKPIPVELTVASWNVYVCGSTTNLSTMCTGIHDLINLKEKCSSAFRDIMEMPVSGSVKSLNRVAATPITPVEVVITNSFNESQITAVREALNNPMTLIWGPPGTGKTTVVVEILMNFLKIFPHLRILVSASTHNAVDNVMERFLKERERMGDNKSEDAVRLSSDCSKISTKLKKWTLDAFVGSNIIDNDKAKGKAAKKLKESRIVFSTCSGAGVGLLRSASNNETSLWPIEDPDGKKAKKKKKSEEKFDVVIVDEASQITEPNAIIPIVKCSKYVILVGDHVQLRPTVAGELAKELGLETSLFEKLYISNVVTVPKIMLDVQYRMHSDLSAFASKQFYEGKLRSGVLSANRILPSSKFPWPQKISDESNLNKFPFVFVNCGSPECFGDVSKSNKGQAEMTVRVVKMLRTDISPEDSTKANEIIILTPYTKQVKIIEDGLKNGSLNSGGGVKVNTIDGFQGKEADIIIFCTVRSNRSQSLGFLEDSRRLNVAVTRARFGLIVIGNEDTLRENELWKPLLAYAQNVIP